MKSSRFQYEYRASASKRHKLVGDILRTDHFFRHYTSYQEYPVNRVAPQYESGREHFDWVVPALHLVLEIHGEQHFTPIRFGGISTEDAEKAFVALQVRDKAKMDAAIAAGWTYIAIPPKIKITSALIIAEYKRLFNPARPMESKLPNAKEEEYNEKKKARAKEIRSAQYKKQKEWKKLHGV